MFLSTTTLFSLLTLPLLALSSPHPTISPRFVLLGSCPSAAQPTEEQFVIGYTDFCQNYVPPNHKMDPAKPIVATYDLRNADNSMGKWVFRFRSRTDSPISEMLSVDPNTCLGMFKRWLDTDDAGGLGKAYCVVDGTGGDKVGTEGMSKEGKVAVLDSAVVDKRLGMESQPYMELWAESYRLPGARSAGAGCDSFDAFATCS